VKTQGNFGVHKSGRITRSSDTNNSVSTRAMRHSVILSQIKALKLHRFNFLLARQTTVKCTKL